MELTLTAASYCFSSNWVSAILSIVRNFSASPVELPAVGVPVVVVPLWELRQEEVSGIQRHLERRQFKQ
jgi:hypothetical protein